MAKVKTYKVFNLVLYPDSTTYNCEEVLATVRTLDCDWFAALHDKDTDENGELKKAHYHVILRFGEGKTIQTIAKDLQLQEHEIQRPKKGGFKGGVRYLIHANAPEKYQYDKEIIFGNGNAEEYLYTKSDELGVMLMDAIYSGRVFTVYELYNLAKENNAWSEFRRGFAMYNTVLASMRYSCDRKSDKAYETSRAIAAEIEAAKENIRRCRFEELPQEVIPEFGEQPEKTE